MSAVTVTKKAILGADGMPMRASMSSGPYQAGSGGQDLGGWNPVNYSADSALNPVRDTISGRIRDLARNDGWASGALTTFLNNVIGAGLRLAAQPDYRALGLDKDWADDWSRIAESKWRSYAEDPGYYCDGARRTRMGGMLSQAFRHRIVDGEAVMLPLWLPGRGGSYATAFQLVHPARLSNPRNTMDTDTLRGGVEIDRYGAAIAYNFREGHPGDLSFGSLARSSRWERVPRETSWGRARVIHHFDPEEAEQTRGRSPLTPVVRRLRMSGRYEETELQAAVMNALLAVFIESSAPPEAIAEMLAGGTKEYDAWASSRMSVHEQAPLRMNGLRIPILPPGDTIKTPIPSRPNAAGGAFVDGGVRQFAASLGLSYEMLSRDYSKTNYSSARAAFLEAWKTISTYQKTFGQGMATQMYAVWLEEAIDKGEIEIPTGAPRFQDARGAYCRCDWLGPPRGWIDPVKEAQAAGIRVNLGLSTLQQEVADQGGDWEAIADQQDRERKFYAARGLSYPGDKEVSVKGKVKSNEPDDDEDDDDGDDESDDQKGSGGRGRE